METPCPRIDGLAVAQQRQEIDQIQHAFIGAAADHLLVAFAGQAQARWRCCIGTGWWGPVPTDAGSPAPATSRICGPPWRCGPAPGGWARICRDRRRRIAMGFLADQQHGQPPLLHTARSKARREITEITTSRISCGTVERSITRDRLALIGNAEQPAQHIASSCPAPSGCRT